MRHLEDILQSECFKWAWNTCPQTRRLLFSVPNGGYRNTIEAMKLKATGVVSGVPDMIFIWRGKVYGFELKTKTGKLSDRQKLVIDTWHREGVEVHIIRTLEEFKEVIKRILKHPPLE